MLRILQKEINNFFNSLVAYIVIIVFLVGIGLVSWVFPQSNILDYGFANLDPLFNMAPYVFLFLIPAITMRTFAEETKSGTMELLLTRPLTDLQIVLGKFLASFLLVVFALIPTLIYYFSVYELGTPAGNIDTAAVAGSYIGLLMLAAVFTSIGVFSSSVTDNQIVAFVLAIFLCFIFYDGFSSIASINVWSDYSFFISQLGIDYHYQSLSRGLIDIRNLAYFFSLVTLMVFLTKMVLESRKW
ncbi:gliding motility-associated ABC transporter permease subunit GldF [Flexithrix dorotheae]|uniref:gliding motility-associated ABC transporter permease subunit GldF n=1 Tax=Flexithrix dorotheae TaxID=70993 RepID=UPI000375E472|nr:gliding motility-associated ABC transporter permease subunit GldF [Flexithrix dorotheae]